MGNELTVRTNFVGFICNDNKKERQSLVMAPVDIIIN